MINVSKRINVIISDSMNQKLDELSERYGVSKSSIVAMATGQYIDSLTQVQKVVYGNENQKGLLEEQLNNMFSKINKP